MQKMTKGCNKLPTLSPLWQEMDEDFKTTIDNIIDRNCRGSSLLRVLKLVPLLKVDIPTPLVHAFMDYYSLDQTTNSYSFNIRSGQRMNVTLEDVLYLTNLPIVGRPIVPNNNKDKGAFYRLFEISGNENHISLTKLKVISLNKEKTEDERIKAILLLIVTCIIAPNANGHNCNTSFVKFIENLDEVDSYAWGAAMLSYLYQGMKNKLKKDNSSDGFLWLIIVRSIFFFSFIFFFCPYLLFSTTF
jgi:hypothetical protein